MTKHTPHFFYTHRRGALAIAILITYLLVTKFYYYILPGDGYYFFLYPYDPSFLYDDFRISTLWIGLPILAIIIGIAWWIRVSKKLTEHMIHLLVIIALGLSIFGYLLFLVSNERYVYTEHPALLGYRDWQGEYITDTDEYLALVQKYGFDIGSYAKFQTLEESIQALEFAKDHNIPELYAQVFRDMERFGYDVAFQSYPDVTFQVYFLKDLLDDYFSGDTIFLDTYINKIQSYKSYIQDDKIHGIIDDIIFAYNSSLGKENRNELMSELTTSIMNRLYQIQGIDFNIL